MEGAARRVCSDARAPAPPKRELVNFHNASSLDDRGFLLPVSELLSAIAINVNASKLFAVGVVHGNLPVMVLTPLVAFHAAGLFEPLLSHDEWGLRCGDYGKFGRAAQVTS